MRPDRQTVPGWCAALSVCLVVVAMTLGLAGLLSPAGADPGIEEKTDAATPSPSGTEQPSTDPTDPTGEPTATPSAEPTATHPARTVDNAVFRWGLSNQTNARSHNPMAINFLSAGLANPGRGGASVTKRQWSPTLGNVLIQKWSGAAWRTATWAGLGTSATGASIGRGGPFSNHNVVVNRGRGTIDAAAGTGQISWRGTFTVVYYGGNSIFTVTDPILTIANGRGQVTAELGGYAASQTNTGRWEKVLSRRVKIAKLPAVDLSDDKGFTAIPGYLGTRVDGSVPQTGDRWLGSFPQPMIDFLKPMGIDQFWFSTGNESYDEHKLPVPLSISYDASRTVHDPTPTEVPSERPTVTNTVNPHTAQPRSQPRSQHRATRRDPARVGAPLPPGLVPEVVEEMTPGAVADLQAVSAHTTAEPVTRDHGRIWWVAGLLGLLAALLLSWRPSAKKRG